MALRLIKMVNPLNRCKIDQRSKKKKSFWYILV